MNVLSCLKTWIISCFSDNWKSNFSHLKAITKAALTLSKPKKLSVAQHGKTSRDNSSFLLFLRISYSEFPKNNSQKSFPLSFYIFFLIHWIFLFNILVKRSSCLAKLLFPMCQLALAEIFGQKCLEYFSNVKFHRFLKYTYFSKELVSLLCPPKQLAVTKCLISGFTSFN